MVFTSHFFIFYFLPAVLAVYYALPRSTAWRNAWLLVASYFFYGWWNPWFVCLILGVSAINYACGRVMAARGASERRRQAAAVAAVTISLGLLVLFKYAGFLQVNANRLLALAGLPGVRVWEIVLPVGISFYTFQALSYAVDVYRRDAPPARSFSDFACYIALFPQMIAGPIVRYGAVVQQLRVREYRPERFATGVALFIMGFAKKVLLANPLGPVADAGFGAQAPNASAAWLGLAAYALQIYFDFSGYSDMAVGLGRLFGFEFMRNFDAPYRAESITDFWRRWHISLSTFLRDYLYVPLGGNRRGARRTYANLAMVMLLGGLWHGANWTFVVWGAYHGALLIAERWAGRKPFYQRLPRPARVGLTFLLVLFSWVWFRAETLSDALAYFGALFGAGRADGSTALLLAQMASPGKLLVLAAGGLFMLAPRQAYEWAADLSWRKVAVLASAFAWSIAVLFTQTFNPFLYFQF